MAERDTVRLSLRLITASRLIERRVDALMRAEFGSTISRFDFLSALDRRGEMTLGAVSQHLLVSNGNVTGLATRLREDGLIETRADPNDRRVQTVRLTARGESVFKRMAKAHADLVDQLLGALGAADRTALMALLDRAKAAVRRTLDSEAA